MKNKLANAEVALAELIWRNPIGSDGHSYELNLALWGMGLVDARPAPGDFGQDDEDSPSDARMIAYAEKQAANKRGGAA